MTAKLITILLAAVPGSFAQDAIKDALVKHWKTTSEYTLGVAQAMPAEQYNFRPTAEGMTFGQAMADIGAFNYLACSIAAGIDRPEDPPKLSAWGKNRTLDIDKDTAVQYLSTTFAFCNRELESLTAERLNNVMGPATRRMTAFEWLWAAFTHTSQIRGHAEVYLRSKAIKGPGYAF